MNRSKRRWLAGLVLVLAAPALWGLIEPRMILDENHETVAIPAIPAQWQGKKIAVIADLQIGMWLANEGMVQRAMARIVEERPAAVLMAGDFLYKPIDEEARSEAKEELDAEDLRDIEAHIAKVTGFLRPLVAAGIPSYAVLGNHDYLQDDRDEALSVEIADRLAEAMRRAGIVVLRNEAVVMKSGEGPPLYIGGIDSLSAGVARPAQVLAMIPGGAPRIMLMHDPDVFADLPPYSAPLAVAGHTHGGQVRIPGLEQWSWMALTQHGRVTADGWIRDYGAPGNALYVNRGIGFSLAPIRIFCPPELTWITLTSSAPAA